MVRAARGAPSYWFETGAGDARFTTPAVPGRAEAVVVGGGVIGLSAAYWLARRGAAVVVLDGRCIGWGASGRNAGLLLASSSPLESLDRIREVLVTEAIDADLVQPGHLALAASAEVLDRMQEEVRRRPAGLPPLSVLDRDECEQLLGVRLNTAFTGGRWLPSGAAINPLRLLRGLAAAVVRHGGLVAEHVSVRWIRRVPPGDRLAIVTTAGTILARHAVVAAGVRSASLAGAPPGLLTPSRAQMLATVRMAPLFRLGMAVDWGAVYWRQTRDGTVVIGGCRSADADRERTVREGLNRRIQASLESFLPRAFPGIGRIDVATRWSGIMDQSPDGRPLAGLPDPNRPVWMAAGFGGHGLPPALGVGEALADSVRSGRPSRLLDRCDPRRFANTMRARAPRRDARAELTS